MIAILDCGSEDSAKTKQALDSLGADARIVSSAGDLARASKIILPNGGSFPELVRLIRDRGLVEPLLRAADQGVHILAVSHGMHVLMDVSYEDGQHTGLGVISGKATAFDFGTHPAARHFVLPHQGWNQVTWSNGCPLFNDLQSGEYFYFNHSHHVEPLDARLVAGRCNHGIDFAAVVWQGHVFAAEFLPERSEQAGLKVLANFLAL
jgi:glutamine amidotransferase